jgi:hypothetical protein
MDAESKLVVTSVLSVLALGISSLTLYFARFKRANLSVLAGEYLNLSYFREGNCGITLSVNIANAGARLVTVRRLGLLVQEPGSGAGYLLEPLYYQGLNDSGDFVHESQPVPIPVEGYGSETRQVLFRSSFERPAEFRFRRAGVYRVTVLVWLDPSGPPHTADDFTVALSEAEVAILETRRETGDTNTWRVRQAEWRLWGAHHLAEADVAALRRRDA